LRRSGNEKIHEKNPIDTIAVVLSISHLASLNVTDPHQTSENG
jgi:hypothetical protein